MKEIEAILDAKLKELLQVAHSYVDEFWSVHLETNPMKEVKNKSRLALRARLMGSTLTIEWMQTKWIKDGNKYKPLYSYIKKGKGFGVSKKTLQTYSQPWEYELVCKYEDVFTGLRQLSAVCGEIRRAARKVGKLDNDLKMLIEKVNN